MFKVNNKDTRTTPTALLWFFIANSVVLLSLLLTLNIISSVSVVNFEQINAGWVRRARLTNTVNNHRRKKFY